MFDPSETAHPSLTAEQRGFVREQLPMVERLEAALGYAFAAPELAVEALTHPSFAAENRLHAGHYQRLEFVGDAFLGMVVARELWHRMPTLPEGQLSRLRAELISEPALAEVARRLGFGKMSLMGRGELRSAGTEKDAILADLVEAALGAVFLDGGFDTAYRVTVGLLGERLEQANAEGAGAADPKSALQEHTQATAKRRPDYALVETRGPAHEPWFVVSCTLSGVEIGRGEGKTRRLAERAAAVAGLATIRAKV